MKNENKTAFPTFFYNQLTGEPCGHDEGMTLRDYFANSAMTSIVGGGITLHDESKVLEAYEYIAKNAYLVADAMLKQREL